MKKSSMARIAVLVVVVGVLIAVAVVKRPAGNSGETDVETTQNSPEPEALYEAVKDAYGEDYLPNMRLTDEEIESYFGVTKDLYASAIVEIPMISTQVDTFALFQAKDEASKEALKEALVAYQGVLENDTFQYPANLLKIQASTVFMKGDYVCFIMLGTLDNETMQQEDESKVIEAYRAENEKAIEAMRTLF